MILIPLVALSSLVVYLLFSLDRLSIREKTCSYLCYLDTVLLFLKSYGLQPVGLPSPDLEGERDLSANALVVSKFKLLAI